MNHLKLLLRLSLRFGWINGMALLMKLRLSPKRIKIPGIMHPFTLRKKTSDEATFHQLFTYNGYGGLLSTSMQHADNKIFIDGGAILGYSL
jgi:hypothetical protein